MRNNRFNVRTTFGFGRNRGLLFAGAIAIGILFFMITIYNGSPVVTTKVQAAGQEFRGGATPGMLAVALNFSDGTRYAVFGGRSISNRGSSTFRGNVGSDGSVTGIEGYSANVGATGSARQGLRDAINKINQLPCEQVSETDLSGKSFSPGVYCLPSADLAGVMTVNGSGDSNSVFVFRVSGTMTTRDNSTIALAEGAKATNVYFVAGGDVNVGSGNDINANVLSSKTVTIGDSSRVGGKTLSSDGDVVVTNSVLGAGTGSVEICKALTPGDPIAIGTIFTFNVTGLGTQVQVPAGACSAPMDVAVGNQTITEVARANTAVVGIAANPANRLVSTNLPQGSAVVSVPEGGVTDQTIVTFTNQTTRTGTLEICKQGLDLDVTGFFQYTVQGAPGQTFNVPVGFCSGPITVTIPQIPNTTFTANVTELARPNFRLAGATTLPNGRLNGIQFNAGFDANGNPIPNTNGGYAQIVLISGGGVSQQTTVNFFNVSLPGIVKVCKITADPVNIPAGTLFHFTVTGTVPGTEGPVAGRAEVDVPAGPAPGFCQIVPGTWIVGQPVTVTETGLGPGATLPGGLTFADTRVSAIVANPATPAATVNLDARSIVTTARNTTVEVTFTNFVFRPAVLKICKNAGPGVANGTPFTFSLSAPNPLVTRPISTTPFTVLAGTCVFAQGPFPPTASLPTVGTFNFGTGVTVTEASATGVTVTAIASPTGGPGNLSGLSLPNRTATITLTQAWLPNSNFNEIAFTNSAAAVQPTFRTRLDFDGDGKADPVIFRPSTGTWWFAASGSGMAFRAFQWGQADDSLVSADYDGDGITDYAVYRKGAWYVMGSSAGYMAVPFGTATDIPQPGDYDGDGKADFVVYRPSEGIWYMMLTTGTSAGVQFGISTDRPVAADFDGDGKMDPAVYRNGTWYILASSTGFHAATFGVATDRTVPADYDGDHKADLAVYRNGEWYILRSTDGGVSAFQWGTAGDVPTPADYNGDGMTDVTVYRPSSNTWFMNYSGQNSVSPNFQFGSSGDQNVNY